MIVEKRRVEDFTLLNVEGTIKLGESAAFFAETLERALSQESGHVMVDLSKIREMDSTGLGELVDYLGRFKNRRRKLILVNPSDQIRRLLRMTRLHNLFPIHDSLDEALQAER